MTRVMVVYDSQTGHTEKMAEAVAQGARSSGAEVIVSKAGDADFREMANSDALVVGSPTHFGGMSEPVKSMLVKSLRIWGELDGKVGAAFTSSLYPAGGNETAVLSILHALMIHGMVVVGNSTGSDSYYGGISFGAPSGRSLSNSEELGRRVAEVADRLK